MIKYQHVLTEVFRKPWAILPEKLAVIAQLVSLRAAGSKLTLEEIEVRLDEAALRAGPRSQQSGFGALAVIPIRGVISHRINMMSQISGGTSIDKLTSQFRQALGDASIRTIVFDVDSPGGGVEGVPELADEIFNSRGQKKTIAVSNSLSASAAYWLAASAGEMVVIPSGEVGSIGVFCAHEDVSEAMDQAGVKVSLISAGKFKVEGNPFEPLSAEARAELQSKVDAFYGMFVKSVARGRNVSQASVRGGFGQGRLVLSTDAVKIGMADRVATFDQTIGRITGGGEAQGMLTAQASGHVMSVEDRRRELDLVCAGDEAVKGEGVTGLERRRREIARMDLARRRREIDLA